MTPLDQARLLRLLAAPEGRDLLAGLPPYRDDAALGVLARLRAQGVTPELAAAALTQSRLRDRAVRRWGPGAAELLLTQDGLEQATRPVVAARRAQRFLQAGVDHVWDLGCGLGLDALALARAGLAVTAVERDPVVAAAATANLADHPRARVITGDATRVAPGPEDGVFLDPARRTPGVADVRGRTRRTAGLTDLSPSWEDVQAVAGRSAAACAKLSPGTTWADLPAGVLAEWVSVDGDAVECAVWWGAAVDRPGPVAVVGTAGPPPTWTRVDPVPAPPAPLTSGQPLQAWLGEPDRAVLAAGLTGSLAAAADGQELATGVGYVTAPAPVPLSWVRWFEVLDVLPLRAAPVRAWLREHGHTRVTLKKRGAPVDPDTFRAQLRLPRRAQGPEAVLVLTRAAGRPVAVAVRPAPAPPAGRSRPAGQGGTPDAPG